MNIWDEVFEILGKNRFRMLMTGISVANGVFIMILLIALGRGIRNGITKEFEDNSKNKVAVKMDLVLNEYNGFAPKRRIQLKNEDYFNTKMQNSNILEYGSPCFEINNIMVNFKNDFGVYSINGVNVNYPQIEGQMVHIGRFISQRDNDSKSKVAVIGYKIYQDLLKNEAQPIGKKLVLNKLIFQIIGIYKDKGGEFEEDKILIPIETAQLVFNGGQNIDLMYFTLNETGSSRIMKLESKMFSDNVKKYIGKKYHIGHLDSKAIKVYDTLDKVQRYHQLVNGIERFFWLVGICNIIAGMVGVGNIMYILVKERVQEIGIRKSLGAKPASIVKMIIYESVLVTLFFGIWGLISGVGLLYFIGQTIEIKYIRNPYVDFNIVAVIMLLLMMAGVFAGVFPAWTASRIRPAESLRQE